MDCQQFSYSFINLSRTISTKFLMNGYAIKWVPVMTVCRILWVVHLSNKNNITGPKCVNSRFSVLYNFKMTTSGFWTVWSVWLVKTRNFKTPPCLTFYRQNYYTINRWIDNENTVTVSVSPLLKPLVWFDNFSNKCPNAWIFSPSHDHFRSDSLFPNCKHTLKIWHYFGFMFC